MTEQTLHPPQKSPNPTESRIAAQVASLRHEMQDVFFALLAEKSISGQEQALVKQVEQWAESHGLYTDLWQATEESVDSFPQAQARHIPLANRPTLVLGLPTVVAKSTPALIFNAHSDVVDAPDPDHWKFNPWAATAVDTRIYGRGACDVKGPLISALWAMRSVCPMLDGKAKAPVLLELVPGEEDAVGLGTLTSVLRGYHAAASIVLEPTEGLPRCASRPGLRFSITIAGKAVHGTMKWMGEDAIAAMRYVLTALEQMEQDFSPADADPLFADYPIARPITVDFVNGGRWQGMVADQCNCAGYFELLATDQHDFWREEFTKNLIQKLCARGLRTDAVTIDFTESYAGHRTDPHEGICQLAEKTVQRHLSNGRWMGWKAFNSGCEAGLRAQMHNTPTLVWGPGSLAQAHGADEFVDFREIELVAGMFAQLIAEWLELR